jgi:hypothetical protein
MSACSADLGDFRPFPARRRSVRKSLSLFDLAGYPNTSHSGDERRVDGVDLDFLRRNPSALPHVARAANYSWGPTEQVLGRS